MLACLFDCIGYYEKLNYGYQISRTLIGSPDTGYQVFACIFNNYSVSALDMRW